MIDPENKDKKKIIKKNNEDIEIDEQMIYIDEDDEEKEINEVVTK